MDWKSLLLPIVIGIITAFGGALATIAGLLGNQIVALAKYYIFQHMCKMAAKAAEQEGGTNDEKLINSQKILCSFAHAANMDDMVGTIGVSLTKAHVNDLPPSTPKTGETK
jgi:hypothetical protein